MNVLRFKIVLIYYFRIKLIYLNDNNVYKLGNKLGVYDEINF